MTMFEKCSRIYHSYWIFRSSFHPKIQCNRASPSKPPCEPLLGMARRRTFRALDKEPPRPSLATCTWILVSFVGFVGLAVAISKVRRSKPVAARLFTSPSQVPNNLPLDAILILGGGVPHSVTEPPVYVRQRCDDAVAIRPSPTTPLLCLSAGTAHLPQLMSADGLPVWESTACAGYLGQKRGIVDHVFVETTSYDTIGNAFFARTSFADVLGWKRLMVVTNEFHMARTKAIFDWIFVGYDLYYLSSNNTGLSDEALRARAEKEATSLKRVSQYAGQYPTLRQVWTLLNTKHDLYAAPKLVERATKPQTQSSDLVKQSYGLST